MVRRVFFMSACSILLFSTQTHAQDLTTNAPSTTIEAPPACTPAPKDPAAWDRSVTSGFSYTDGNSNTNNIYLNGKIARDYESNAWNFETAYNFGSASSGPNEPREETRNDVRGKAEYRRILDNIWFAGFGTSFVHDDIADLRYRIILNPSVGAYLVREDDLKFSLETGPSYIFEDNDTQKGDYLAPRIADRFEWKISDTAKVFQTAEWLHSIEDSDNYIINAEAGLEAAITSMVDLVFRVRDAYDNLPAEGRERNDVAFITGFKFNL